MNAGLLETVRQYALERLELRGETACMRDRHAMYFVRLVEGSEGALTGHGHLDAQARLDREQDNCRAALQWMLDRKDAEPARCMAGGLGRYWFFRGYLAEGEGWFERVLALPDSGHPTIGRARCIYGLGRLALSRADYAKVVEKIEAARELYRELGDTAEEGWALFCLGFVARARGDYPRARALLEQGLEASRASRNGTAEANCLWSLAEVANDLGDDQQARAWAEAGLARATEVGWLIGVTVSRRILGAVHIRQGNFAAASEVLHASLAEARAVGARWWIAETLAQLAQLALEQSDSRQAGRSLFESLNVARDLGDLAGITRGLEVAACLAVVQQAPRPALQLAGAAARLRGIMLAPKPPADRARFERRLPVARRCLRRSLAEAAYADGSTLPLQHSIELALARARIARDGSASQQTTIRLTPREVAVSRLIAQGLSNRQIAQHLVIAEGTAERHVGNILEKLEMTSRAQIAGWAVGAGLVQPSSQPRSSSQRDYMPQM